MWWTAKEVDAGVGVAVMKHFLPRRLRKTSDRIPKGEMKRLLHFLHPPCAHARGLPLFAVYDEAQQAFDGEKASTLTLPFSRLTLPTTDLLRAVLMYILRVSSVWPTRACCYTPTTSDPYLETVRATSQ